jgi:hypothetical protein
VLNSLLNYIYLIIKNSKDKTVSQSARASSTEIENTLLDALLNSSFYGNMAQPNRSVFEPKSNNVLDEMQNKISNESPKNQPLVSASNEREINQDNSQKQTNVSVDDGLAINKPVQTKLESNQNENDNVFGMK